MFIWDVSSDFYFQKKLGRNWRFSNPIQFEFWNFTWFRICRIVKINSSQTWPSGNTLACGVGPWNFAGSNHIACPLPLAWWCQVGLLQLQAYTVYTSSDHGIQAHKCAGERSIPGLETLGWVTQVQNRWYKWLQKMDLGPTKFFFKKVLTHLRCCSIQLRPMTQILVNEAEFQNWQHGLVTIVFNRNSGNGGWLNLLHLLDSQKKIGAWIVQYPCRSLGIWVLRAILQSVIDQNGTSQSSCYWTRALWVNQTIENVSSKVKVEKHELVTWTRSVRRHFICRITYPVMWKTGICKKKIENFVWTHWWEMSLYQ